MVLGRLALQEIEKRSEAAVGIVCRLAILEAENLERDFVQVGFRAPSTAILLRHVVPNILSEPRGCSSRSPASAAAAAASGLGRRAGWRIAATDAIHGNIAVTIGSRSAPTLSNTATPGCAPGCAPRGRPVAAASTRTGGRRHWLTALARTVQQAMRNAEGDIGAHVGKKGSWL